MSRNLKKNFIKVVNQQIRIGAGKPAPPATAKAVPAGMYWVRKTPLQEA